MCIGELMFHLISQDGMTPAGKVPGQQPSPIDSQTAFVGGRSAFADLVTERAPRAVPSAAGQASNGQPEVSDAVSIGEVEGPATGETGNLPGGVDFPSDQGENEAEARIFQAVQPDTSSRDETSASDLVDPARHGTGTGGDDAPTLVYMPYAVATSDPGPVSDTSWSDDSSGIAPMADIHAVEKVAPPSLPWSGATSALEHRFSAQTLSHLPSRNVDVAATYAGLGGLGKGPDVLNIRQVQSLIPGSDILIGATAGREGVVASGAVSFGDGFGTIARGLPEAFRYGTVTQGVPTGETSSSAAAMTTADPVSSGEASGRATVADQPKHIMFPTGNAATEPGPRRNDVAASADWYPPVPQPTSLNGMVPPAVVAATLYEPKIASSGVSTVMARAVVSESQRSSAGADRASPDALVSPSAHQELSTEAKTQPLGANAASTSTTATSPASASLPAAPPPIKTVAEAALQRMSLAGLPGYEAEVLLTAAEVGEQGLDLGRLDTAPGIGRAPAVYGSNATMSPAQGAAAQIAIAVANGNGARTDVVLDPEELGKVRMNMVSDEQSITMFVMAERPETLELLRRNIDILAQEFRELGFSNVTFAFGDGGTSENPANGRSSNTSAEPADVAATSREPDHRPTRRGPDGHLDIRL